MSTEIFLGHPPPNVMAWIENKYKKTIITFDDNSTEEYSWTGEVNQGTLAEAGIFDSENYEWLKNPVSIQFGTTVTTVGDSAFAACTSLTSVSMPNVQTVGEYAFSGSYLVSVTMPSVTEVGNSAFSSCNNLVSVTMPSVTEVGNSAFTACWGLTSVSMPNVQTVGIDAFNACVRLASVTMPNATTVDGGVFYYISNSAEFKNQTTSTIEDWFGRDVFGHNWGPATIACSNGSVYAEWDGDRHEWTITITITPAQ